MFTTALIVCLAGAVIYAICDGREQVPAFVAKMAFACFWVGLLAFLLKG